MPFLVSAFLFLAAAGLIFALFVGVTLKVVGLLLMALLVVAGVSFVMSRIRRPGDTLNLDHPLDRERLPR